MSEQTEPDFEGDFLNALQEDRAERERILDAWLDAKWAVAPFRMRENREYMLLLVHQAMNEGRKEVGALVLVDPWAGTR